MSLTCYQVLHVYVSPLLYNSVNNAARDLYTFYAGRPELATDAHVLEHVLSL